MGPLRTVRSVLACTATAFVTACAATTGDLLERLAPDMPRAEVVAALGAPSTRTFRDGAEVLRWEVGPGGDDVLVVLRDGRVAEFGRAKEFRKPFPIEIDVRRGTLPPRR